MVRTVLDGMAAEAAEATARKLSPNVLGLAHNGFVVHLPNIYRRVASSALNNKQSDFQSESSFGQHRNVLHPHSQL